MSTRELSDYYIDLGAAAEAAKYLSRVEPAIKISDRGRENVSGALLEAPL